MLLLHFGHVEGNGDFAGPAHLQVLPGEGACHSLHLVTGDVERLQALSESDFLDGGSVVDSKLVVALSDLKRLGGGIHLHQFD